MKCKECKYWQMEDELPGISEYMECTRINENDPDWWKKWHFRGPNDSCEYGEKKTGLPSIAPLLQPFIKCPLEHQGGEQCTQHRG